MSKDPSGAYGAADRSRLAITKARDTRWLRAAILARPSLLEAHKLPATPPLPNWRRLRFKRHREGRGAQATSQLYFQSSRYIAGSSLPLTRSSAPRKGRGCQFIIVKGVHLKI